MDTINITVTGRLGDAPRQGTTKAGKPWASFTLAADVPTRNGNGDREYETRWYQVWATALSPSTSPNRSPRATG